MEPTQPSQIRVLLVDNDKRYIDTLGDVFENEGYNINIVYDGQSAEKKLQTNNYEIVITDFGLSDTKGDTLAKKIREVSPNTFILLITGFKSAIEPSKFDIFDHIFEKNINPHKFVRDVWLLFEKRRVILGKVQPAIKHDQEIKPIQIINESLNKKKIESIITSNASFTQNNKADSSIIIEGNLKKNSPEMLVKEIKKQDMIKKLQKKRTAKPKKTE